MSAVSRRLAGIGIVLLGIWGGIVSYVGPAFGYRMQPGLAAWSWTTSSWELHLLPGIGAVVGGLLILGRRPAARFGGYLALASGAWFVLGPLFASMWLGPSSEARVASSGLAAAARPLGYHYGTGLLIAALAAWAVGRMHAAEYLTERTAGYPAGRTVTGTPVPPPVEPVRPLAAEPLAAEPVAAAPVSPSVRAVPAPVGEPVATGPAAVDEGPTSAGPVGPVGGTGAAPAQPAPVTDLTTAEPGALTGEPVGARHAADPTAVEPGGPGTAPM